MVLAVTFTILPPVVDRYTLITGGLVGGAGAGVLAARFVKMTAMPQMVAAFNGFGGGASVLVAFSEYHRLAPDPGALAGEVLGAAIFSALIGAITFTGSMLALAKLQELMPGRPVTFPAQPRVNAALRAATLVGAAVAGIAEETVWMSLLILLSLVLGVLFVLPIGGADMPVVIAFLNAFSGLSGVGAGFVLDNNALIIGGTLVGASGTFLTVLMSRAMNRSLGNVFFGAFGAVVAAPGQGLLQPAGALRPHHGGIAGEDVQLVENADHRISVAGAFFRSLEDVHGHLEFGCRNGIVQVQAMHKHGDFVRGVAGHCVACRRQ
jgi:H+-translocating NAD(P) transhydrogenase subunit beta